MKTNKLIHSRRAKWASHILLALLFGIILMGKTFAQSTVGKDFWVGFLPVFVEHDHSLSLIASGPRACTGIVSNPNTNWSKTFSVSPGVTTNVTLPYNQVYDACSDCFSNIGLHVVTTDSISLYAANFQEYSFDVTNVLPTESLGCDYTIQTYHPNNTVFNIVATEDNTSISITLSCNSLNGHYANQPFSITLDAGKCYQLVSNDYGDLSGTVIHAEESKRIAVFAGNICANIPSTNYCCCDHIVEQQMPIECWGKQFVVTGSKMRSNDIVRVTALNDNCMIWKNGALLTTINAMQTYQFEMTANTPAIYLETSEPASVFLYFTGSEYGGENGDPSMVIINPIEQQINDVTFSTFNSGTSRYHYVNVVTDTDKKSYMRLDGNNISSHFTTVPGNSEYSYARIQIPHRSHTLSNSQGGFVAHVYGLGDDESYAYSVGSMAKKLTSQLMVDGHTSIDFPSGFYVCEDNSVNFELNMNFNPSLVLWNFGDGTTGSGQPVTHTYNEPGDYTVSCNVYRSEEGQNILESTLTSQLHVGSPYQGEITENQCDSYTWNGATYTQSGDYVFEGQSAFGCDSIVTLHLTINPSKTTQLNISACESYEWYGETYTQSGTYEHIEQTSEGCDSTIVLNLTIDTHFSSEEFVTACNSYTWRGNIYTESGFYQDEVQSPSGCDSTFILNLTMGRDYTIDTIVNACNEYVWDGETYTQSGQYSRQFTTSLSCDSLVMVNLTIENTISEESAYACDEYPWRGNVYTTSGIYQDIVSNPIGCDSIYILNLAIGHSSSTDFYEVACEEYDWDGETLTESGDYTKSFPTIYGCDSTVMLHLTVMHHTTHVMQQEHSCEPEFIWHGHRLTENGVYYDTTTNAVGCHDIYSLELTFGQHYAYADNLTVCDSFPWPPAPSGFVTDSGYYYYEGLTSNGCDSIVSLFLNIGKTPVFEVHGITQVAFSSDLWPGIYYYCIDSIGILPNSIIWSCSNSDWILTPLNNGYCCELIAKNQGQGILTASSNYDNGCDIEKHIEINATNFDIDESNEINAVVFPNPVQDELTIQADQITQIRIFDSFGVLVLDLFIEKQDIVLLHIDNMVQGLYLVEINTTNGRTVKHLIISH